MEVTTAIFNAGGKTLELLDDPHGGASNTLGRGLDGQAGGAEAVTRSNKDNEENTERRGELSDEGSGAIDETTLMKP